MGERLGATTSFAEFSKSGLVIPRRDHPTIRELSDIYNVDIVPLTMRAIWETIEKLKIPIADEEKELLRLRDKPIVHEHKTVNGILVSPVRYRMDALVGKGEFALMVSDLPPNSHTYEHGHERPVSEDYIHIAGKPFLGFNNDRNEIFDLSAEREPRRVPFDTGHQLGTRTDHALTLIAMHVYGTPREGWHKPIIRNGPTQFEKWLRKLS